MTTYTDPGYPTLLDWAKRQDPSGVTARIVNVASKKKPVLDDIPFEEGNLDTGHRVTRTSTAISGTWRKLNAGISPTKGTTDQFDETCGMLEDESVVDKDNPGMLRDPVGFRRSEDDIKVESLAQQMASAIFYASAATNPEQIHGLTPRYPATSGYTTSDYTKRGGSAAQSGGTADNRSIWIINWAPRKVYGVFPKGSQAGLQQHDRGLLRVEDPNDATKHFYAWVKHFQWKLGIVVEDYRHCVRLQWDPSDTTTFSATNKELVLSLQDALNTIADPEAPGLRIYMDRVSKARIDRELAANGEASLLSYLQEGGKMLKTFMGVPFRIEESLVAESYIA